MDYSDEENVDDIVNVVVGVDEENLVFKIYESIIKEVIVFAVAKIDVEDMIKVDVEVHCLNVEGEEEICNEDEDFEVEKNEENQNDFNDLNNLITVYECAGLHNNKPSLAT